MKSRRMRQGVRGGDSGRLVRERGREVQEDEAGSPGRRQW